MTHEEETMVLDWLRRRGACSFKQAMKGGLFGVDLDKERRILQRALRNDEYIIRDIRDAMAAWIEEPASLLLSLSPERRLELEVGLERLEAMVDPTRQRPLPNIDRSPQSWWKNPSEAKPASASPADPQTD
jgi:hypothetical protein